MCEGEGKGDGRKVLGNWDLSHLPIRALLMAELKVRQTCVLLYA